MSDRTDSIGLSSGSQSIQLTLLSYPVSSLFYLVLSTSSSEKLIFWGSFLFFVYIMCSKNHLGCSAFYIVLSSTDSLIVEEKGGG